MLTTRSELPLSALAGGLALLGGLAAWQLGIEFERAWMRSSDGLLMGETLGQAPHSPVSEHTAGAGGGGGEHRRWVTRDRPRLATWPARLA
jgi:hypothetical protein